MLEWILRLVSAILGRESASQIERNREQHHRELDTRENFKTLQDAYSDLMEHYQLRAQQMEQKLDLLTDKVELLESALERERIEHKECRRQLHTLTEQLKHLKGRVDVIQQKQVDDA